MRFRSLSLSLSLVDALPDIAEPRINLKTREESKKRKQVRGRESLYLVEAFTTAGGFTGDGSGQKDPH
jgi:hypothetical protein